MGDLDSEIRSLIDDLAEPIRYEEVAHRHDVAAIEQPRRTRALVIGAVATAAVVLVAAVGAILLSETRSSPAAQPRLREQHATAFEIRRVIAVLPADDATAVGPADPELHGGEEMVTLQQENSVNLRLVVGPVAMTAADVRSARPIGLETVDGVWPVVLELTPEGQRKLGDLAAKMWENPPPQNEIALITDGVVQQASFLNADPPANIEVHGSTKAEAERIAAGFNRD